MNIKLKRYGCKAMMLFIISSFFGNVSGGTMKNFTEWNIVDLDSNSDVVLKGRVELISPAPFRVQGKRYYQIVTINLLKGKLNKDLNYLSVITTEESVAKNPPKIDGDCEYLMFLRKIPVNMRCPNEQDSAIGLYELTDGWKGIIALCPSARENRVIRLIEQKDSIDIEKHQNDFFRAIKTHYQKTNEKDLSELSKKINKKLWGK